jgi:hypothetical protein
LNVHTFNKAIKDFGKYPIAENLDDIECKPPEYKPFKEWFKTEVSEGRAVDYE